MKSGRLMRARATLSSYWYPNARERLSALLPELLLSVIAITCMSIAMSYHDGSSVAILALAAGLTQIFVQGTLYVCTYLIREPRGVNAAWLILPAGILASEAILGFTGLGNLDSEALTFACPVSIILGVVVFYVMRPRWTFAALVAEMLALVDLIDEIAASEASILFVHIVCVFATTALLMMRRSATRIAMLDEAEWAAAKSADTEERPAHTLGMHGQIAALVLAVCFFCLMTALATTPAIWRPLIAGDTGTVVATDVEPTAETEPVAETAQVEPVADDLTPDEMTDAQPTDDVAAPDSNGSVASGLPLIAMLLALLVLPIPLRLLTRKLTRFSLGHERRANDRAAKIYLGIISRLAAVGIVRDETNTPYEFLSAQEDALVELTSPVGVGLDEWMALTDTYEKARYAGLNPTALELETCWKIYDALPSCARTSLGWRSYLTGAFWRM